MYMEVLKMKAFMDKDFLLETETAQKLYHEFSAPDVTPVIDYHCHINPKEIWEDRKFENITQVWLGADHYKWRFMRSCGVEEKYITNPDIQIFILQLMVKFIPLRAKSIWWSAAHTALIKFAV